jgi:hypothetical protein
MLVGDDVRKGGGGDDVPKGDDVRKGDGGDCFCIDDVRGLGEIVRSNLLSLLLLMFRANRDCVGGRRGGKSP